MPLLLSISGKLTLGWFGTLHQAHMSECPLTPASELSLRGELKKE
jgi:hypothetical protein